MTVSNTLVCVLTLTLQSIAAPQGGGRVDSPCGSGFVSLKSLLLRPEVSVVFSGTVLKLRQLDAVVAVTFDVDRTWKGRASKQVVLYRPAPDRRVWQVFEVGERYIVLAHRLTAAERAQFHVETAVSGALATGLCGDGSRPFAVAAFELGELGPGRPPR